MIETTPFHGAPRARAIALAVGVAGLALTGVAFALDHRDGAFSYLLGFAYWAGLGLASLTALMIFHASRSRWMVVIRRLNEFLSLGAPLFALLFIPIVLALPLLFDWASGADLGEELNALVAHRRPYLNPAFFALRGFAYLGIWFVCARLLFSYSTKQDETGALDLTVKQRVVGSVGLPLVGFAFTFASFDWLMSLNLKWSSSMFGIYYFAGSFVGAIALIVVTAALAERAGLLKGVLTDVHWHNLGKLLFAFTVFWGYIAFSQYLLVWIANLPEELPWMARRTQGEWQPLGVALVLGQFVLPFVVLLPRAIKRQPRKLALVAVWILVMHWVDLYWLIMPRAREASALPHWGDFAATLGVGGVVVAFLLWRAAGKALVPARDPFLDVSLRYNRS